MPLYLCNTAEESLDASAKACVAEAITRIHCDVTGAPATFVHVFFLAGAPTSPLDGKRVSLLGTIRAGRTEDQKAQLSNDMSEAIINLGGLDASDVAVLIRDTPASWVMEGGDIMPEPGEEAAWLEAHEAKLQSTA